MQVEPSVDTVAKARRDGRKCGEAGATGLEPATSAVTGQRSNLLSYAPAIACAARTGHVRALASMPRLEQRRTPAAARAHTGRSANWPVD